MVENHLSWFVEGQDPSNVELIWDQMWRSTMNYGRKGIAIQAILMIDLVSIANLMIGIYCPMGHAVSSYHLLFPMRSVFIKHISIIFYSYQLLTYKLLAPL